MSWCPRSTRTSTPSWTRRCAERKSYLSELGPGHTPAAADDIFARDPFSFWIQYFYAYLEYDPATEAQGYTWVNELASSQAWIGIQAGSLTPTGETYRELIGGE